MIAGRPQLAQRILAQAVRIDGETVDAAESLCHLLEQARVRPGSIVLLSGLHGRNLLVAALAVWQVDAVPMPATQPLPALDEEAAEVLAGACQISSDLTVMPPSPGTSSNCPSTTAVLHLSSGSTNRPKVALRSVVSVLQDAEGYRTGLALIPSDQVAVPVPIQHSFGWGISVAALLSGCDVDVTPFARASTLARKVDTGAVSVLAVTPPLARLLVQTQRQGDHFPRAAMAGAGPVSDDLDREFHQRFGVRLQRGYGSTETGGTFFGNWGIGQPVSGVKIVTPAPGERGELVLHLAAPIEGYLGARATPTQTWRTGDVVRHGSDGRVDFEERARGPLRLNGRFIRADLTERALRAVPGVQDVYLLVLPRTESPEIEDFYALVEGGPHEEDLRAALSSGPSDAPVPRVVVRGALPRTVVGKLDRQALIETVRKVSQSG